MRIFSAAPLSRSLAFLAILAALLLAQTTYAVPARATELGGVFTDVQIVPGTVGSGQTMEITASFTIPAGAVAGDTFTLALNDPFNWVADSFDILDPDTGEVVAHVVVTGTLVTFTLTDYVESHLDISGSTSFYTYFDRGSVEAGDVVEATFTTKDDTFIDEVTIEPAGEVPATRKEFRWTDRSLQDGFTFAVGRRTERQPIGADHRRPQRGRARQLCVTRLRVGTGCRRLGGGLHHHSGRAGRLDLPSAGIASRLLRAPDRYPGRLPRAGSRHRNGH